MNKRFQHFAKAVTDLASTPQALVGSIVLFIGWLIGGLFVKGHFSNSIYQLYANTGTTWITFILGFAILVSTSLHSKALMTKIDALIEAQPKASNTFVGIEDLDDEEIEVLRKKLRKKGNTRK